MNKVMGWVFFLLMNLCFAVAIVYIVDTHEDAVWSFYWGVMALFCCYALFLAGWLIIKHLRLRFGNPAQR